MAIDTSRRIVAQIGMCPEHIQEKHTPSDNDTGQGNGGHLPTLGRQQPMNNFLYFHKTRSMFVQRSRKKANKCVIYITLERNYFAFNLLDEWFCDRYAYVLYT